MLTLYCTVGICAIYELQKFFPNAMFTHFELLTESLKSVHHLVVLLLCLLNQHNFWMDVLEPLMRWCAIDVVYDDVFVQYDGVVWMVWYVEDCAGDCVRCWWLAQWWIDVFMTVVVNWRVHDCADDRLGVDCWCVVDCIQVLICYVEVLRCWLLCWCVGVLMSRLCGRVPVLELSFHPLQRKVGKVGAWSFLTFGNVFSKVMWAWTDMRCILIIRVVFELTVLYVLMRISVLMCHCEAV